MKVGKVFSNEMALRKYKISATEYADYVTADIEDLKAMNRAALLITLFFCGLVTVVGPFVVKESKMVPVPLGKEMEAQNAVALLKNEIKLPLGS